MVDEMANITGVTMPSFDVIGDAITTIKTEITNCKSGLLEYDTKWVTELADLEEYIATVKTIVEEYEGADGSNVTTYKNQSFFEKEIVQKAGQMFETSSKYVEDNQDKINLAVNHQADVIDLIIDQASKERENRGYQLIAGGIMYLGGALIILATGGGGAPLVAAGFATISAGSCGVSNIYEGYQDVKYGREKDFTSQSYNIVRDGLLFGDVKSYEFFCRATDISLTTVNIWSGCNMISGSTGSMCTTGTKGVSIYISGEVAEECVGNFVMENVASLGVGSEWSMAAGFLSSAITGKVTPVTPTTRTYIDTTVPGMYNNVWNEPYMRNYPETSYDFNLNRQYNIDSQYLRNTGTDGRAYNPIYDRFITSDAHINSGKTVYTGADNNHTPETTYIKGLDTGDKKVYNDGDSSNAVNNGATRAAKYSSEWGDASLQEAIDKFAPNVEPVVTSKGKIIYNNPETGISIVYDKNGNYFRIEDTTRPRGRNYLDMDGNDMNNEIIDAINQVCDIIKDEYEEEVLVLNKIPIALEVVTQLSNDYSNEELVRLKEMLELAISYQTIVGFDF